MTSYKRGDTSTKMIKPITELTEKELYGKKVLLRVDFNVPVADGKISEIYRIRANKETIDYLTSRGAIVALLSHITAINSFEPIFRPNKRNFEPGIKFYTRLYWFEFVEDNLNQCQTGR